MRCKFCFATFQDVKKSILPKGHLSKEQSIEVIQQLAEIGFEKITFAGGEPTLCPWLPELIRVAKNEGLTTMIVTNGSRLTNDFLEQTKDHLDWIALSIDSIVDETNLKVGRALTGKDALNIHYYKSIIDQVKAYGFKLKLNTVVNRYNYHEDLSELIHYAKPYRWKVFQVLPIKGQNDNYINSLTITSEQFEQFLQNHFSLNKVTKIVTENNNEMKGSYAMVDPAGRFYDNANGVHNYSKPIIEIGARLAIKQVNYDFEKFVARGGIYNWGENANKANKITLSGDVASGKTTIGKLLADRLNYQFVSLGNIIREKAIHKNMSIVEFQKACSENPELDIIIDKEFSDECNAQDNLIIDYRMGFNFIKNAYHIYLKISEENAIDRLKKANRPDETFETIRYRNESFKAQFINAYQVDYTDCNHYNLIIDVGAFENNESIIEYIISKMHS
jgi:radical S-adenosyl methionine domain-containing protein 2